MACNQNVKNAKIGMNMGAKKKKELKKNSLVGDKIRAGTLLSTHLRKIAQEPTEFIKESDGDRMGTKAEALARLMWKMALGYTTTDVKTEKEIIHFPDRGMIQLIWDRVEGRATPVNDNLTKKRALPKKVSEESKRRLNNMATGDSGASNTDM